MASGHVQTEGLPERWRPDVAAEAWRTPAEWAEAIRARGLGKAAEGIIETGLWLLAAKAALGHGRFLAMPRDHLKVSADVAEEYMCIGRAPVLQDSAIWRNLPASRAALVAFVHLKEQVQMDAIVEGRVHPGMTAKDVRHLGTAPEERAWDRLAAADAAMGRLLAGCPLKDVRQAIETFADLAEDVLRAYGEPLSDGDRAALCGMRWELEEAEPGQRFLQRDDVGKVVGALRQPSTYPVWMGQRRTRGEADRQIRVIDKLLDGQAAGLLGVDLLARARGWRPSVGPSD